MRVLACITAPSWKLAVPICAFAVIVGASADPSAAATCNATGFMRDNINLTAALINPGSVSGDVDATGCNIGVYYAPGAKGQINNANIHGANYYGIVNNGGDVSVQNSAVSDIGEKPFNGT
jgi:hypothetical protein